MQYIVALVVVASFVARIEADCTIDTSEELQDKEKKLLERLAPLTKANQLFTFRDDPYQYDYTARICNAVDPNKPDAGIVQTNRNGTKFSLGRINQVNLKAGTNWMMLEYRGGDKYGSHCDKVERTSVIMILCDSSTVEGTMSIIEEHTKKTEGDCYYLFELYSNVVCSNVPSSIPGGLSVGSVLVLIFVVVVGCYFLFGFLYQRFVVGAKGMEQIPHYSFWKDFGNLQADGCELVCRTQEAGPPRTYKGIGDDQLGLDEDDERDDHLLPM